MSNILFLAAIILAIPTFGLSLVAVFIFDWILLCRDSNRLSETLMQAFNAGSELPTQTRTNGSIKYLFKKHKAGEIEEEKYPSGFRSFSGYLLMPWHPSPLFVHVIRERSGFTTVSAEAITRMTQPSPGASAQERVDHLMNELSRIRQS